jgi:hypothetical protein
MDGYKRGFALNTNTLLLIVVVVLGLAYVGVVKFPGATGGSGGVGAGGVPIGTSCPTIVTQALVNKTYDMDKQTTAVGNVPTVYLSAANGQIYPGGSATKQLASYDVLLTPIASYFGTLQHITTDCSGTPVATGFVKGVDTPTVTVKNGDGTTTNADTATLAIGASGSATVHLKFSQAAAYKHLTGESGTYCVFFNATYASNWSVSQSSASFNNVPCTPLASAGLANAVTPSAISNQFVMGFACKGVDFQANDGGIYDLAVKLNAATGIDPTYENTTIVYGGADYYTNTVTGAVGTGCAKDDGSVIQTLRGARVEIS